MPDAVSMLIGGAAVLISVQGAAGVRYIQLALLSSMTVYMLGRLSSSVLRLREGGDYSYNQKKR